MQCFSPQWLESFLIWLVVVLVLLGIVTVVVPALMNRLGPPPGGEAITTILGYVVWGVIAIFAIIFAFDMIACVVGNGGFRLPR